MNVFCGFAFALPTPLCLLCFVIYIFLFCSWEDRRFCCDSVFPVGSPPYVLMYYSTFTPPSPLCIWRAWDTWLPVHCFVLGLRLPPPPSPDSGILCFLWAFIPCSLNPCELPFAFCLPLPVYSPTLPYHRPPSLDLLPLPASLCFPPFSLLRLVIPLHWP